MTVRNDNRDGREVEIRGKAPKFESFPALYAIVTATMEGERHGEL